MPLFPLINRTVLCLGFGRAKYTNATKVSLWKISRCKVEMLKSAQHLLDLVTKSTVDIEIEIVPKTRETTKIQEIDRPIDRSPSKG